MDDYESPRDTRIVEARRSSFPAWLMAIIVMAALVIVAFAFGLIDINPTAETRMPDVSLKTSGGQALVFDVDTATIDLGTEEKTIEVPTVDVKMADAKH